ncbi:fimbrial protein [Salmonella enterica subsp. enterica]|nr:fimbrial protein [Salmonella enterica subsp. enterica serovar Pensacola]
MKKKLIVLAVAVSAVVSSSAMAWSVNGSGGSIDLGGTLTPAVKATPWEVYVGSAVTNLNTPIQIGDTSADVPVNSPIPVLGIRLQQKAPVLGSRFIGNIPQINYGDKLDLNSFKNGVGTMTLDVFDKDRGSKIGTAGVPLFAAGISSWKGGNGAQQKFLVANQAGQVFYGGLPKDSSATRALSDVVLSKINPEFGANYASQDGHWTSGGSENFPYDKDLYSAYYGSGIEQNALIKIKLTSPASANAINWKATMPVVVTYK